MWSVISLILSFAKNYITIILGVVAGIAILTTLYYRYSLISLELKLDKLREIQEVKVVYLDKIIEKEKVVYQDKIKYIKEYVYDNNKSECENAISVIRRTNL